MKESKSEIGPAEKMTTSPWVHTSKDNIVGNVASGRYYARITIGGKDLWKSLRTDKISVAEQRLRDLKAEVQKTAAPVSWPTVCTRCNKTGGARSSRAPSKTVRC